MKKLLIALVAIIALPLTVHATKWEEGKHYTVVPGQPTNTPELREYFSYYCPACRSFESLLPEVTKAIPDNAKFVKTHADYMQFTSQEIQYMIAQAKLVADKTGLEKPFSGALFNHIQTERKKIDSLEDLEAIYVKVGGDAKKFQQGMKSFSVISQAKRDKKNQDRLHQGRYISGVPAFVVNGKYTINVRSLDNKNFVEEFKALVSYLFTL
ncbi:thiol:disulfide interchange protein DsbA/DsbL [Thalassotalea fusca]